MENLTLSQAKEIYSFLIEKCDNKEEVKLVFNQLTSYEDYEGLKSSLRNDDIKISEFLTGEYYHENNLYYSYDYYTQTREGDIILTDYANFCQYFDEYTSEELTRVYIGRNEEYYCESAILEANLTYIENEGYYDESALDRNDFRYCEDISEYRHENDCFWDEDNEVYVSETEPKTTYIRNYHYVNGTYPSLDFGGKIPFFVGLEIEKEDIDVKESININDFDNCTGNKWRKERDGSLNDNTGYELISPTMELNLTEIENHIRGNKVLVKHINAKKSTDCGGHINLSEKGKTGIETFNELKGYTPLFHALYYGRVGKNYSKGKSNKNLISDNEKYQSVKIHDNRIEYRIIGAVENVNNLMWRLKLIDFITKNKTGCIKEAFFKANTELLPLLKQVYNTNEKLNKLMNRIVKFTLEFEGMELQKQPLQMFIEFNDITPVHQ